MGFEGCVIMLVPGEIQLLVVSMCFVWRPATSINKCDVLIAHVHANCLIHTQLFSFL